MTRRDFPGIPSGANAENVLGIPVRQRGATFATPRDPP
jgi:hypothetical protein